MRCGKPVFEEEEFCGNCRGKRTYLTEGRSLWIHKKPVTDAVYGFKFRNKRNRGAFFAEEMAERFGKQLLKWEIDEIIPVPLHRIRQKNRGYNQSEIISVALSELTGIPVRTDVLFRIKKTRPQKSLGRSGRALNLNGAFAVAAQWKAPENVLLVDDIYTTGATLQKAAKMLKLAGCRNVYFLTISIGQDI